MSARIYLLNGRAVSAEEARLYQCGTTIRYAIGDRVIAPDGVAGTVVALRQDSAGGQLCRIDQPQRGWLFWLASPSLRPHVVVSVTA